MDVDIKKLSLFLSGKTPPDYKNINRAIFFEALISRCWFTYDKIDFYWKNSKEYEEEFYFLILDFLYQKDKKNRGNDFGSILDEIWISTSNFSSSITLWSDQLPLKILIIEDKRWVPVWENFFQEWWIEGVKIVSSDWCTEKKWEKALILDRKLNPSYNPKVFRIIDRDWFTDDQINKISGHFDDEFWSSLNYKFDVLLLNEIENIILQSPTYETTPFFAIEPDVDKFILSKCDSDLIVEFRKTSQQRIAQNKIILGYAQAANEFEVDKQEMEKEMKLDMRSRMNWKDVISLLKTTHSKSFDPMSFLKSLKKSDFPEALKEVLSRAETFFA